MELTQEYFDQQLAKLATKADVNDLKGDIAGLKTDVAVLQTDVTTLKTDVSELKTDVAVLKTDVSELKTDIHELNEKVDFLIEHSASKADIADLPQLRQDVRVIKTALHIT